MKNQNQNDNTNNNNETNRADKPTDINAHSDRVQGGCKLRLPLMKTPEDAMELCRLEQDNVYMSIFMIQCWLGHATLATSAEYAEKKDPRTRNMQSGQAWRSFMETVGYAFEVGPDRRAGRDEGRDDRAASSSSTTNDQNGRRGAIVPTNPSEADLRLDHNQLAQFIVHMFRSVAFEDPILNTLREALFRYIAENGQPSENDNARQIVLNPVPTFLRICDWLDSVFHQGTHMLWYLSPLSFDPDPEKRELASLGMLQRRYANATEPEKAHWHWHFADAAKQYVDSPKFAALADGFKSSNTRVWNYQDVDVAVITLWPLVKRHNWTYADLLKVIRPKLKRPEAYPCDTEQSISAYCINVLGSRKTGKGRTSKGELAGADVARRLLGVKG